MEKLSMSTNLQKTIDLLKNTECSQKEKLSHFSHISHLLMSSSMHANPNYPNQLSAAIQILLMFCEESDSAVRMNAEENLNRIIRHCQSAYIVRIQYDLYHEIRKNGNDRSLRICLNLFAYYCHLIKQRKIKPYAINMLPCIYAISKRKETLLIETLSEFLKMFCRYLQLCLNENEIVKLMEVFINDTISDCAIKRRCASQNVMTLIEHSRRQELMSKIALNKITDLLIKSQESNTIVGSLGFLRMLLPILLQHKIVDVIKMIEILDVCMHLLIMPNVSHTIINASLEVICVIVNEPCDTLKRLLTSYQLEHIDIVRKRKSLKNVIFNLNQNGDSRANSRKSSAETIKILPQMTKLKENLNLKIDEKSEEQFIVEYNNESSSQLNSKLMPQENYLSVKHQTTASPSSTVSDDKLLLTYSDIEMDSFKSIDFEHEDAFLQTKSGGAVVQDAKISETISLKSQKSTESIGSFINSLLSHPNTETVSKFFRSQKVDTTSSPQKAISDDNDTEKLSEMDNVSLMSLTSHQSMGSEFSTLDMIDQATEPIIDDTKSLNSSPIIQRFEQQIDQVVSHSESTEQNEPAYDIHIGTIFDQTLLQYLIRLVSSKFLLAGRKHQLIDDKRVRISIKSLSLTVLSNCVKFSPESLLLTVHKPTFEREEIEAIIDIEDLQSDNSSIRSVDITDKQKLNENEMLLDIKDDHFGESTCGFFEFLPSLSKSVDNTLLAQLKHDERQEIERRNSKLNTDLSNILSKSEIIQIKKCRSSDNVMSRSNQSYVQGYEAQGNVQLLQDILLFFNHKDPILRGNIQLLIGKFLKATLSQYGQLEYFFRAFGYRGDEFTFVKINLLLEILLMGFTDKIHMVVKQSLVSIDDIFPLLLAQSRIKVIGNPRNHQLLSETSPPSHRQLLDVMPIEPAKNEHNPRRYDYRYNENENNTMIGADTTHQCNNILLLDNNDFNITIEHIIDELLFVYENKYWLVQCKYCELISKFNFKYFQLIYGFDAGELYEDRFLVQVYAMLRDNDSRVRNSGALALCGYVKETVKSKNNDNTNVRYNEAYAQSWLLMEFVNDRIFSELPKPLCNLVRMKSLPIIATSDVLAKVLYSLTNKLLEIDDKNQQLGVIGAILELTKRHQPIQYHAVWNEFNLLDICFTYINQNYTIGIDLTCQCDLIEICTNLLAGNAVNENGKLKYGDTFLRHIMKLVNMFHNILNDVKPVFIPKGQKADIFTSQKEWQLYNHIGYYGNDYFYLKLHTLIKASYDGYKISINRESGSKVVALLKECLHSLSVILDILSPAETIDSIKLIEEILIYLPSLMYFTPNRCIVCIRQLFKYMFHMNYSSRRKQYEFLMSFFSDFQTTRTDSSIRDIFMAIRDFNMYKPLDLDGVETPVESTSDKALYLGNQIKIFESVVIQCLKLFTKSNADVQSVILSMLCQVLEYKVNYCLLDANNVFIDFIHKLIEQIESGIIRNSDKLVPNIIRFLFHLSKQRDKQLITVPKIINITDTLLANNLIISTSVLALNELAFEFFFNDTEMLASGDRNEDVALTIKETNTQKEVAYSMLMKFIDNYKIQNTLCAIYLYNSKLSTKIELDFLENILQLIEENKIIIDELYAYEHFRNIFHIVQSNITIDSNSYRKILKIFCTGFDSHFTFSDLTLITLSLQCIINFENINEYNFLLQLKKVLNMETDCKEALTNILYQILLNCIKGVHLYYQSDDYICIMKIFLQQLFTGFEIFVDTRNSFRILYMTDDDLLQRIFTLLHKSYDVTLQLLDFLVNFGYDRTALLRKMNFDTNNVMNLKLKSDIVERLCSKYPISSELEWCDGDIDLVVEIFMENTLTINDSRNAIMQFLIDITSSEKYSIQLLNKMKTILRCTTRHTFKNVGEIVLKILDNSNTILSLSVQMEIVLEFYLCATSTVRPYNNRMAADSANLLCQRINSVLNSRDTVDIHEMLTEIQCGDILELCEKNKLPETYPDVMNAINDLFVAIGRINSSIKFELNVAKIEPTDINEDWFFAQCKQFVTNYSTDTEKIVQMLYGLKSENYLYGLFALPEFSMELLSDCINYSIQLMIDNFRNDCIQYSPHINYLKMPLLLKVSMTTLQTWIQTIFGECRILFATTTLTSLAWNEQQLNEMFDTIPDLCTKLPNIIYAMIRLMESIDMLEGICLKYVESKFIDRFLKENLLQFENYELLIELATFCIITGEHLQNRISDMETLSRLHGNVDKNIFFKCADCLLKQKYLWNELNQTEKYTRNMELILAIIYKIIVRLLKNVSFIHKFDCFSMLFQTIGDAKNAEHRQRIISYQQAAFFAKLNEYDHISKIIDTDIILKDSLLSISTSILRTNQFYFFAITPYEILVNHTINLTNPELNRLPSIPIEYLNDVEIIEKFVSRINLYGFSSRQQFEELFMSLLVLVNTETDLNMIDAQEHFKIKNICLLGIIELLLSCKMYPQIGCRLGKFHHFPRTSQTKPDTISLKKLHKIQQLIPFEPNVFYQSNLERSFNGKSIDNIIGTSTFGLNQIDLNCIWQFTEDNTLTQTVPLKNARYFLEQSGVDSRSSVQLIFDVFSQLIEENYVSLLPHLPKLCEICENVDQFKWVKITMMKLQHIIPIENVICHEYIIYCLCKSVAVLVPTLSELIHLCTQIQQIYLKSVHLCLRNATLNGLLCLAECCVKTNTTIGGLSEELTLIRNVIVNYIINYGIIKESSLTYSDKHTKLVWTLNFYLIETTSKFVTDCNLLSNTIISANNILKRTTNMEQYLCVLHGLERLLVLSNVVSKVFREKIEKIALDLVKLDNEKFSLPALKLLITCMYMGSAEQLEKTEYSNGIVQDEPEVIMQSTEKIDILFQRIKLATPTTAIIYGNVLCQIINDLVPPNEILTKVIKELLTLSQPHRQVIAKIVFKVFRSAIDSSYHPLLQDWLICSLPNFLSFSVDKALWCLIVIFISASINLNLIKIYPTILAKHDNFNVNDDNTMILFVLVARDFYSNLNDEQKERFRFVFENGNLKICRILLDNL